MKYRTFFSAAMLLCFLSFTALSLAQPGGGYPGGPGGRPGGRPPMGERGTNGRNGQQGQIVKPKKKVREGDTFKIVGTLKDSVSGEALPFVNVAILDSKDSSLIKGGVTNMDGYFEVLEVPTGSHLVRISAIGYQTKFIPCTVTNHTALGTLLVKPGATMLKGVTITAKKPLYAMSGEKMIYNVSEDPSIQTGTTTDALQNAPGVEVDIEGNVTLRGVSNVEIWINDKPSRLTAENLKTYLETLPANALSHIETITNPSAKYATTAEAVINIVTTAHIKSNHFISFGANASSQPNVSPWLSYTWANERLTINAFASGRFSQSEKLSQNKAWFRQDKVGTTDQYDTLCFESDSATSNSNNFTGHLSLNISYEIDSMSDISLWGNASMNFSKLECTGYHLRNEYISNMLYEYNLYEYSRTTNSFSFFGGDYTKKFDRNGHNLRISLDGSLTDIRSHDQHDRIYLQTDNDPRNQSFHRYTTMTDPYLSLDLRARYNRPYSKDGEMSYGLSYNFNNSNTDKLPYLLEEKYYDGFNLNDSLLDALLRYTYASTTHGVNGDAEWEHRWGGFTLAIGIGIGLRNQQFSYTNNSQPSCDSSYLWITYNPSIHLTYRTESMHNIKFNYSLRMKNPSGSQLSTFRRYSEDSYSVGNPNLTQGYTHSGEIGWTKFFQRFGNVGLEGYARLSTNEVSSLTDRTEEVDEWIGRIVNYSMPYNVGTSWRYGTSANVMFRPTGFFNMRLYANLYNYGYTTIYRGETSTNEQWSYSIRLNTWAKILKRYQIHASANYSSPTIGLMSTTKARYSINCGVRADFFKRKLSAYINVRDIFNWGKKVGSGSTNTNPYYLTDSNSYTLNSRFISAGVTLRFGKMELERGSNSDSDDGAF